MKNSNFDFFYKEFKNLFWKVKKWFWLIFKAQAIIAIVNTIITIFWYYIVWYFFWWFQYLLTMAIIVFLCSFIPILWMWISAIPLCFIAWNVWWINAAFLVLAVIIVAHMIEAYILNPKIVSSYLELPISITFVVLILSEHFFWMIWFLIWMPLFYILLDLFKDFNVYVDKVKKRHKAIRTMVKKTL
jgi:predicted PurR-regulated permease PerM